MTHAMTAISAGRFDEARNHNRWSVALSVAIAMNGLLAATYAAKKILDRQGGRVVQVVSLVWGILAVVGMIVGFFPCLGALNWINIPFAAIGAIIAGVALSQAGTAPRGSAMAGLIMSLVAVLFGLVRLLLGGGIV